VNSLASLDLDVQRLMRQCVEKSEHLVNGMVTRVNNSVTGVNDSVTGVNKISGVDKVSGRSNSFFLPDGNDWLDPVRHRSASDVKRCGARSSARPTLRLLTHRPAWRGC